MPGGPKKHARGFTEDKEKPLVQLTQKRDTAIPESILVEKKKKKKNICFHLPALF